MGSDVFEHQRHQGDGDEVSRFARLSRVYSHFRPRALASTKDVLEMQSVSRLANVSGRPATEAVTETVSLEPHENFSQLCALVHLVREVSQRGIFRTLITISEGTVRVQRDWLADQARSSPPAETSEQSELKMMSDSGQRDNPAVSRPASMLWVDSKHNFGFQTNVQENTMPRAQPLFLLQEESPAVSYSVKLEGDYHLPLSV